LPGSYAAIQAVLRGLASRPEKGFYIQTSGAFLIGEEGSGESASRRMWNDIADIELLTTMPPDRYHQRTDQLVRDGSANVNVAIVSPTVVYGVSTSTENQVPITIRDIIATAKELSAGFTMAQGRNILGYVHVNDLAGIYVRLFADAIKGAGSYDAQFWGPQAYYFANGEEFTFAAYMEALVKILKGKGVVSTDEIKEIGIKSDAEELKLVNKTALIHGYGANVRCRSERAETLLGWEPKERSVKETLPEVVDLLMSRDLH
jgi:nucleoside-diphosphate-sugar epimerase